MNEPVSTTKKFLNDFIETIVGGLPAFLGALVILIIGYFVGKGLAAAVHRLLVGIRLDQRLHTGHGGNIIQRAFPSPTNLLAKLTFWVVFLFGLSIAVSVLGIPVLVDFVRAIYGYLPNVIAAILIFLVASAVAAGIATVVHNIMGDTPTGKAVASAAPAVIMGIAIFMILNQLRIAPQIVTITYAALIGSAALASALAFGLGGRDVAGKVLGDMYEQGQRHKGQVAQDVTKGAQTAKAKANDVQARQRRK